MEKSQRLMSLDVLRGLTIAGMIMVNNPGSWGSIYPALGHAKWHGVTPTDLVFPFFLFIVGVAITLSLTKRKERGDNTNKLILNIIKRAFLIFLVGMILNGFPYYNLSIIRIPGVLQRIAVVYLISAIIFLKTNVKTQGIIAGGILVFYWMIMTLVPVPGIGYSNLEPATNLAAYFDNLILGGHLWSGTKVWDPEGILSTLPAVSTALSGILLGHWLKSKENEVTKVVWMFVIGNLAIFVSMFWDMAFPINKGIWTSSYVMYSSGLALIMFGMCYFLVDIKGYKWWIKPFEVYGMNAIAVYFLSGIVSRLLTLIQVTDSMGKEIALKTYLYNNYFLTNFSPLNASLVWALLYVLFWLGMMWILYWKKIFIKL